jgi:hypothetical protein
VGSVVFCMLGTGGSGSSSSSTNVLVLHMYGTARVRVRHDQWNERLKVGGKQT